MYHEKYFSCNNNIRHETWAAHNKNTRRRQSLFWQINVLYCSSFQNKTLEFKMMADPKSISVSNSQYADWIMQHKTSCTCMFHFLIALLWTSKRKGLKCSEAVILCHTLSGPLTAGTTTVLYCTVLYCSDPLDHWQQGPQLQQHYPPCALWIAWWEHRIVTSN